jgi:hypothetical protein
MSGRSKSTDRRNAAVVTESNEAQTEREALRALRADLQVIVDAITSATTLAELRGFVKDIARIIRRLIKATI